MLGSIVAYSIRYRAAMIVGLAVLLGAGFWAARTLPIDALPDVSTIQVSVLTNAPGLSAEEVEQKITIPVETAVNGTPGSETLRSTSRGGLSAVTVIFREGTDVWLARQLVLERLRGVQLPPGASVPALAPVSTGLGDIYQFVVRSAQHSPMQLRTMLDWDIVPKLRGVPGVVEINTMGGDLKQYQVRLNQSALVAQGLSLAEVADALREANTNVGGGWVEQGKESFTIRGEGMLSNLSDIENVVVRTDDAGTPVLIKHIAQVVIGRALPYGVITHNGKGRAVTGVVMMLLGSNSRDVVHAVGERIESIRRELPPGVQIDTVYDRKDFVDRTVRTVLTNLVEGVALVTLILALFLGSFRGAAAVVLGIPASMAVALMGMHAFGVPGDLMSLGAIDFGFLVDGPIVILEGVIAATAGRKLVGLARANAYAEIAAQSARPVAFSVAIIMLVYIPLLTLEGVEGKMFRPMALTMACALFGSLVYGLLFFPAVMVAIVPPARGHGPRWIDAIVRGYSRWAPAVVRYRWLTLGASVAFLALSALAFAGQGAEFVPRIFEGDAVLAIRRPPSIGLSEAERLDLAAERVLQRFPEVKATLAMTGRGEVAIDPVGSDSTEILLSLAPPSEWKTARDFDGLSAAFKRRVEARVPSTFVSVSQPIEDRTNEMISGSRADVSLRIFGPDTHKLARLGDRVGQVVKEVPGAGDVRIERILGQPVMRVVADRLRMATYGVSVRDAFAALQAARQGYRVGQIYEDERRFDLTIHRPMVDSSLDDLGELYIDTERGESVPLRSVTHLESTSGVTAIRRENRQRTLKVDVNLRGRDLVSWVSEARAKVAEHVSLPPGYRIAWGGQFENFERAQRRLAVVVPVVVLIIVGMLMLMFGSPRVTAAVFLTVPLTLAGGMLGLLARGLSFSLPAAVGFIALGGIAVLNGVVIAQEVLRRLGEGASVDRAVAEGTSHMVRAVLTTAAVAALGFLPMAMATSAGAEVQRPLATAVVAGMIFGVLVSLGVLPGLLRLLLVPRAKGP